jgi:hypothetical protein
MDNYNFSLCGDEFYRNVFLVPNPFLYFNLQLKILISGLLQYLLHTLLYAKHISIIYIVTIRTIVKSFIEIANSW